jgi:hypothetical protein
VPVTRREWLGAVLITVGVVCLLQLPYLLGYIAADATTEYTGLMVNVEDGSYLAAIEMGRQGAWQYQIRFTSEPHAPVYLYMFYIAAGHVARLLQMDTPAMWHLMRGVMNGFMFLAVFGLITYLLPTPTLRRTALLLAMLGSGLDWFLFPWETFDPVSAAPLDIRQPEAHLFFSALTYSHYGAAAGLLTLLIWSWLVLTTQTLDKIRKIGLVALAAVANLALLVVHPFLIFLSLTVTSFFWMYLAAQAGRILWREGILLALIMLPSLPLLLYYYQVLSTNPVVAAWNAQAVTLSPNPLHYLLAYAPYLVPAGWGALKMGRSLLARPGLVQLWLWILVVALLLYAPVGAQRRFVEGVQVPLAILATQGLGMGLTRLRQAAWFQAMAGRPKYSTEGLERLVIVGVVALLAVPNLYLYLAAVSSLGVEQVYPMFRPRAEIAAMEWLRQNARSDEKVISAYLTGSYLPYRARTLVYLGQRYETVNFETKQREVEAFFGSMGNAERLAFLRKKQIVYVFYGRAERDLGVIDPAGVPFLRSVFENGEVSVFEVRVP